jgi:hypothetical protein
MLRVTQLTLHVAQPRRYRMRKVILITILTVGAVAAISAARSPAQAQYSQCIKGRGCIPTSQASYNACFNLALARGESSAWGERRSLNWFIYQCLAGKIPFDEPRRARRDVPLYR